MLREPNLLAAICFEEFDELFHTHHIQSKRNSVKRKMFSQALWREFFVRVTIAVMGTRRKTESNGRVGHYVKEWRKHRGLTQEQLAGRLGVATSTVSQLETGKQGYSQATLEALAEALSCEPWQLISMDPGKEGEVIDLVRMLNDAQRDQALRVLRALTGTG